MEKFNETIRGYWREGRALLIRAACYLAGYAIGGFIALKFLCK